MIPMCWKCTSRIVEKKSESPVTSVMLVGCKESNKVKDYNSAVLFCPLTKKIKKDV